MTLYLKTFKLKVAPDLNIHLSLGDIWLTAPFADARCLNKIIIVMINVLGLNIYMTIFALNAEYLLVNIV